MMIENKKVITRSLIVLFLSLSVVYSLTYQKKQSLFKSTIRNWNTTAVHATNTIDVSNINKAIQDNRAIDSVAGNTIDITPSWDLSKSNWNNNTSSLISNNTSSVIPSNMNSVDIKLLPGTAEYFGTLDIVSILGQKPRYTLQDSKWNYFAYYGDRLDFVGTVQTLGWNVYEMVTEAEILQNQLFGDKISYINLSMFRDIRVLMVIEIDDEVWLLQIPADKYHQSKDYLKSLFIH